MPAWLPTWLIAVLAAWGVFNALLVWLLWRASHPNSETAALLDRLIAEAEREAERQARESEGETRSSPVS